MHYSSQPIKAHRSEPVSNPLQEAVESRDSDILTLVRNALTAKRVKMAIQPVVNAKNIEKIVFYESLIRLLDESGRMLPAAHFISKIENTALGREMDCIMLTMAFNFLAQHQNARLSVNVSARSIADAAWRRTLDAGLTRYPNLSNRLVFEVNETSAMQLHEVVVRFMQEMQPKGIRFALDGFGSGLISFKHLKDFYFDLVKIDKTLCKQIRSNPDNQVLSQALITVAQQFDMLVVADGIETQDDAQAFIDMGAECLQGYYFGVPQFKSTQV